MRNWIVLTCLLATTGEAAVDPWQVAQTNSEQSQRAMRFCRRYTQGWLQHADPVSGLLPRRVDNADQRYWNARDCAADNYPFLTLVGEMTDDYHLRLTARHILDQELKLTVRVDSLPDDFDFATQKFRTSEPNMPDLIFGASEYAKDGLIPITEWVGPGPWSRRMDGLLRDVWKHAAVDSPVGKVPTDNLEVAGDLLQAMSRMYWLTGDDQYKEWTFRIADLYLFHKRLLDMESLRLRDHGCEIIGGLSEAYVIARHEDRQRYERYKPELYKILDFISRHGLDDDGMMYISVNVKTGEPTAKGITDGWGYVYDAFLTVAAVDDEQRFRDTVIRTLINVNKVVLDETEGIAGPVSADQMADSLEGAINLLNRFPVASALAWVDREMAVLFGKQRPDGIIEAWYGDGNSARTAMMYALYKTQGITPSPWRDDVQIGADRDRDGVVRVYVRSEYPWAGRLRFDRPRHREYLRLPLDYARINQFPEWFTVEADRRYEVSRDGGAAQVVAGKELLAWPLTFAAKTATLITIKPATEAATQPAAVPATAPAGPLRTMRYTPRSRDEAAAWQKDLRTRLFGLLKLTDLLDAKVPLSPKLLSSEAQEGYSLREVEFNSSPGRRIKAIVTVPGSPPGPQRYPAVVCIHGHGGDRHVVYDRATIYKGFASVLAASGYVTIAVDVGRHEVYEPGRTLMGERLWDLMRCVELLEILPEVDRQRIGCAGLSLGGEMAMWLGAMDTRINGTVSSGFLTRMDQMEHNHCMCWKLDGLRELVDFADIYSLIAPRPLQCQNGLAEPTTQFRVDLAREAMDDIKLIYTDLGVPGHAGLAIHPGGHEIDLDALRAFFKAHLTDRPASGR
ncbi:MAG: acetylxylan esterase [Planctomycetes bacterium]|nr:acetylxylan esterase [Planctomycetota bacterium]